MIYFLKSNCALICFFPFEAKNEETLCEICRNPQRDHTIICVVEKETDLLSLEKTNKYQGVYHILGGLLSEIDENAKQKITLQPLLIRIKNRYQD